jgi:hypothetical protein
MRICWGIVGGFTRSRKCKEIDISIDVIVPLYFIYSQQNIEGNSLLPKNNIEYPQTGSSFYTINADTFSKLKLVWPDTQTDWRGHPTSHPVFSGVRVTRSLVLCVCFVDRCLSFCSIFQISLRNLRDWRNWTNIFNT